MISALKTLNLDFKLIKNILVIFVNIFENNNIRIKYKKSLLQISKNEIEKIISILTKRLIKSKDIFSVKNVPKYSELFSLLEY